MKNWKNVFVGIAVTVISLSCIYAFLMVKVKYMLADKLESAFGRKVNIGQLKLKPPLNLELMDLDIGGLVNIDYVYISPSIPNLLRGRVALNKVRIVKPKLSCERSLPVAQVKTSDTIVPDKPAAEKTGAETAAAKDNFRLVIKSLKIRSGEINFIDHTADARNVTVMIKNIDLNLKDLYTYPIDVVFNFNLSGRLPWQSGEPDGKIILDGWVNPYKKDMSADLRIEDIDAIAFYQYYSTWVDLDKARIDKAKLNFSSKIKGENNDISAQCHLELTDIVRKARLPEEPQQKAERLTDAVLDMFRTMNQGRVVLDFTLHTKMDHPQFGFENIKSAFEGKLMQARTNSGLRPQDMLLWPGKMLQGGIKNGSDLTKAAVDGMFALGNGLKKFFEDAMNKQTSEEE